jgi:hypothetical protein
MLSEELSTDMVGCGLGELELELSSGTQLRFSVLQLTVAGQDHPGLFTLLIPALTASYKMPSWM